MTPLLDVHVPGHPVPEGSLRHIGRGKVIADSPRLQPWRDAVTLVVRTAWKGRPPVDGPVEVRLAFSLPLPASAPTGWASHPRWARPYRQRTGDIDKLARGALDAITASRLWVDDAQVCELTASKVYGAAPGVRIVVGTVQVGE